MLINLAFVAAAAAKSLQSCLTLCGPIDSPVPGILQARTLEWVAISFSNAWKWKVKVKSLSHFDPQWPHGLQPSRLLCPWDFPGKNTGVGCHCLLLAFVITLQFYSCKFLGAKFLFPFWNYIDRKWRWFFKWPYLANDKLGDLCMCGKWEGLILLLANIKMKHPQSLNKHPRPSIIFSLGYLFSFTFYWSGSQLLINKSLQHF